MKKTSLLLATAASLAFLQSASAADIPAKAPIYKAAPAPAWDWTGPYLGVYAGIAASRSRGLDPIGPQINDGVLEHTGFGFTGGGTIGYNWQLNSGIFGQKFVVGLEGDIGYFGTSHQITDWNDPNLSYNTKTSWLATARGRVGLTDGPNLTYFTGGYAALNFKDINTDPTTGIEVSSSKTKSGYAVGSGVETMLGGGWSAKSEYLFINVGAGDTLVNGLTVQTDKHRYHTQRFGLNYLFGAGKSGPLPQTNWSGFYAGIVGGGALASVRGTGLDLTTANVGEIGNNGTGWSAGGQVGYNWMLGPRMVVGVEGDISYLGIDHSSLNFFNLFPAGLQSVLNVETSWIATARGRLGYSTGPAILYVTGGGAWMNVKDTFTGPTAAVSSSETLSGWTVGGGIETTLWGNWSTKNEYLYVDVGSGDTLTNGGFSITADHKFHMFRSALVYRFSGNPLSSRF